MLQSFVFIIGTQFISQIAPQEFCITTEQVQAGAHYFESQVQTTAQSLAMSKVMTSKIIRLDEAAAADSLFVKRSLAVGDCLRFRKNELMSLRTNLQDQAESAFLPIVVFAQSDQSKAFGLLPTDGWAQSPLNTASDLENETSAEAILNYESSEDLKIIVVTCPPDREDVCKLKFKVSDKMIANNKELKTEFSVLARSTRGQSKDLKPTDEREKTQSQRITKNSDLPQGVYHFWASMFSSNLIFGGATRIDLDAVRPPFNFDKFPTYSFLFDALLPRDAINNYWVNEWPLAFALGRNLLRIHGNSQDPQQPSNYRTPASQLDFRLTDGCLNTGCDQTELLESLVGFGFLAREQAFNNEAADPKTLSWRTSPSLGKAFIVVRDSNF